MTGRALLVAALLFVPFTLAGCVIVDRPLLALRSVAGGIHNKRQVSGVRPFFLPDGRLGVAANGALVVEATPGGERVTLLGIHAEVDDPDPTSDGDTLLLVSGREQVTAGGGHNDHVFQVYAYELERDEWRRVTRSRRAEVLPRATRDGAHVVFARRVEYDGWSLDDPWGPASLFVAHVHGSGERRLTGPLFHPLLGLALVAGDTQAVFGARAEGAHAPGLYAVDLSGGGAPRLVLADAYLPVAIPGTDELLVARVHPGGHGLARVGLDGTVRAELPLRMNEIVGLARAPDGARIVFADRDPEGGRFGEYRLWSLAEGADEPVLLERLGYRLETAFKPLDLVAPPSWWFRSGASPGSR